MSCLWICVILLLGRECADLGVGMVTASLQLQFVAAESLYVMFLHSNKMCPSSMVDTGLTSPWAPSLIYVIVLILLWRQTGIWLCSISHSICDQRRAVDAACQVIVSHVQLSWWHCSKTAERCHPVGGVWIGGWLGGIHYVAGTCIQGTHGMVEQMWRICVQGIRCNYVIAGHAVSGFCRWLGAKTEKFSDGKAFVERPGSHDWLDVGCWPRRWTLKRCTQWWLISWLISASCIMTSHM